MFGILKRLMRAGRAEERPRGKSLPVATGSRPAGTAGPAADERAALFSDGVACFRAGDFAGAAERFERCVEVAGDDVDAHLNLGLALQRQGQRADAADSFAMALHYAPQKAEAHFNLGVLDLESDAFGSAARRFEEAVRCRPDYAEALSNLGLVRFRHLGLIAEAEAALTAALAARPRLPDALTNLGMLRHDQGRFDDALRLYDEALRQDPGQHEACLNRSLIRLARGGYARGWEEYEARRQGSAHFIERFRGIPEWDGTAAGQRTVLVYGEQGLGDEILFASCLPDLLATARHCVIDCSPKLEALFRRSFPAATVHGGLQIPGDEAWLAHAPPIDARIPIGSLPRYYRPGPAAFPQHAGYLRADAARTAGWHERLAGLAPGLRVGLSWRGGTARTRRDIRSIPLAELLPLLKLPDVRFVSLQYTDCREELQQLRQTHGVHIEHWQEAIDDYDETAALVAALDLVISVQTAVVHLAGALGRPVWVMMPSVPEWRYLEQGATMPWYPSARLYRQAEAGAWHDLAERVASDLAQSVERR